MDWQQILASLLSMGGSMPGASGGGTPGAGGGIPANIMQLLPAILNVLSTLGAGSYGQKQLGQMNQIFNSQQNAEGVAMNPAALARRTAMATLPINQQLAYSVTKAADAGTAGRGMAQSPGAVASGEASALAPYAEQNLQMGAQDAQFGFPYAFARQPEDFLGLLNQLNQYGRNSTYSLPQGVSP